jgi:hypothetical protein
LVMVRSPVLAEKFFLVMVIFALRAKSCPKASLAA